MTPTRDLYDHQNFFIIDDNIRHTHASTQKRSTTVQGHLFCLRGINILIYHFTNAVCSFLSTIRSFVVFKK
jgi:hypothetical protein